MLLDIAITSEDSRTRGRVFESHPQTDAVFQRSIFAERRKTSLFKSTFKVYKTT